MIEFVDFLLTKLYQPKPIASHYVERAFKHTVDDVQYHFPDLNSESIKSRIISNDNELAIFLFRLGQQLHNNQEDILKSQIHWLLKELCACEIYFNNIIGVGFYVVHGVGTVIGSRNVIGKGFMIYQGCTIGHKRTGNRQGNRIGDNVKLFSNSSIIGELHIGNNVMVAAHTIVIKDIADNKIVKNVIMIDTLES